MFIGSVIANMIIPQLLLKYVYDANTLTVAPPIFEYLPLITYGISTAYFLYVLVANFLRERKIVLLEKEAALTHGGCGNCNCSADGACCSDTDEAVSQEELMELERIVDEALQTKKPSKQTTKKSKSSKKK